MDLLLGGMMGIGIPIIDTVINTVWSTIDKVIPDKDKANELKHAIEMADYSAAEKELDVKRDIIVEEIKQDDLYTKRTRPKIMRWGLYMIFINYVAFPLLSRFALLIGAYVDQKLLEPLALPVEFWVAWGGIVGVYTFGRSAEKLGAKGKLISMVTGAK